MRVYGSLLHKYQTHREGHNSDKQSALGRAEQSTRSHGQTWYFVGKIIEIHLHHCMTSRAQWCHQYGSDPDQPHQLLACCTCQPAARAHATDWIRHTQTSSQHPSNLKLGSHTAHPLGVDVTKQFGHMRMTNRLSRWQQHWPHTHICRRPLPRRRLSTAAVSSPSAIYRPRRSFLYVPASSVKMLAKLLTLHADSICIDLEDGVALSAKATARQHISQTLTRHAAHFQLSSASTTTHSSTTDRQLSAHTPELLVRINPASSSECAADLRMLLECDKLPHAVVLPKVESADELQHVYDTLRAHRVLQDGAQQRTLALVALVETARGLLNLNATLSSASSAALPLQSLIFGGDDYAADIGATRTPSNTELLTARQLLVAHAASHRLQSIDIVHIDLTNADTLTAECQQSYGFGYTGKQCIHPKQVATVEEEYVGGRQRLEWSRRVVDGWEANERDGVGAWMLDGRMIDMPTVKNAQKVLGHARACGLSI